MCTQPARTAILHANDIVGARCPPPAAPPAPDAITQRHVGLAPLIDNASDLLVVGLAHCLSNSESCTCPFKSRCRFTECEDDAVPCSGGVDGCEFFFVGTGRRCGKIAKRLQSCPVGDWQCRLMCEAIAHAVVDGNERAGGSHQRGVGDIDCLLRCSAAERADRTGDRM